MFIGALNLRSVTIGFAYYYTVFCEWFCTNDVNQLWINCGLFEILRLFYNGWDFFWWILSNDHLNITSLAFFEKNIKFVSRCFLLFLDCEHLHFLIIYAKFYSRPVVYAYFESYARFWLLFHVSLKVRKKKLKFLHTNIGFRKLEVSISIRKLWEK